MLGGSLGFVSEVVAILLVKSRLDFSYSGLPIFFLIFLQLFSSVDGDHILKFGECLDKGNCYSMAERVWILRNLSHYLVHMILSIVAYKLDLVIID